MPLNGQSAYRPRDANPQNVAYTGTAAATSALQAATRMVRVLCTTDAYMKISAAGTAATTANGVLLLGMIPEYFEVAKDDILSFIRRTADGTAQVTELG